MKASTSKSRTYCPLRPQIFSILTLVILSVVPLASAQSGRERVDGVKNFGRVTDHYFRGGAVTPDGIKNLAGMGVRTIIDLRDSPMADEPAICQRNGIKYINFPMTGHDTPSDKVVSQIFSIIRGAKQPVYVHCSAGKHRAGTITALYRIRVQGWSQDRAWAEQQSYGFGTAEEHPQLYTYVYGSRAEHSNLSAGRTAFRPMGISNYRDESSKDKKKKDKEKDKFSKSKKDDDEGDDLENNAKKERKRKKDKNKIADTDASRADDDGKNESAPEAAPLGDRMATGLSAQAGYIPLTEAIKTARAEGGDGDLLKVDLEWDLARSVPTWDLTFSSGTEYEVDALSGKFLGGKAKSPAKLALLSPLELDAASAKKLLTFEQILRRAETSRGQTVMEMEMKRIKGRSETVYEVVLSDGATLLYDAATGNTINDAPRG